MNTETNQTEDRLLSSPPEVKNDTSVHLYTLFIDQRHGTYNIAIDSVSVKKGSLNLDFIPPLNQPTESDPMTGKLTKFYHYEIF